jgi:hypothetical protein
MESVLSAPQAQAPKHITHAQENVQIRLYGLAGFTSSSIFIQRDNAPSV